MELKELKIIMSDCMEIGATKALVETGNIKPFLTKSEAYKKYGRSKIDNWIKLNLITPIKDGLRNSIVRLDRLQLEILSKSSNIIQKCN